MVLLLFILFTSFVRESVAGVCIDMPYIDQPGKPVVTEKT